MFNWMEGLGARMSYPCQDHGFWRCMPLTEAMALAWIHTVLSKKDSERLSRFGGWANKVAVIVQERSYHAKVWAVYKHDFRWWLIERELTSEESDQYNWSEERHLQNEDCRHGRKPNPRRSPYNVSEPVA